MELWPLKVTHGKFNPAQIIYSHASPGIPPVGTSHIPPLYSHGRSVWNGRKETPSLKQSSLWESSCKLASHHICSTIPSSQNCTSCLSSIHLPQLPAVTFLQASGRQSVLFHWSPFLLLSIAILSEPSHRGVAEKPYSLISCLAVWRKGAESLA